MTDQHQADPARVQSVDEHPETGSATLKTPREAAGDALRQRARAAVTALRDATRQGIQLDHFRRDPLVMDIHRALDAWEEREAAACLSPQPSDQTERIRVLEHALGNCFMMAKRQIAAHLNSTSTPAKDLERWQHVQRFCETTGSKSSILRGQLPTEMTEGGSAHQLLLPVLKCRTCGCLWRDNLNDTVSLLDAEQKSCVVCEGPTPPSCEIHWLSVRLDSEGESAPRAPSETPRKSTIGRIHDRILKLADDCAKIKHNETLEPVAREEASTRWTTYMIALEIIGEEEAAAETPRPAERATGGEMPPKATEFAWPQDAQGLIEMAEEWPIADDGGDMLASDVLIKKLANALKAASEPVAEGAAIRQLIERWRSQVMVGSQCADELEALLPSSDIRPAVFAPEQYHEDALVRIRALEAQLTTRTHELHEQDAVATDLMAELATRTQERDELDAQAKELAEMAVATGAARKQAEATVLRLRTALREYGQHPKWCESQFCARCVTGRNPEQNYVHQHKDNAFYHQFKARSCDCGLEAALADSLPAVASSGETK